mmetsp:Transcript_12214/g.29043  ORF Transcript_12214/g.29043 Transcript_12214/m.29043 type:complete len:354 (-) Transcript_12214:323-1384(-)
MSRCARRRRAEHWHPLRQAAVPRPPPSLAAGRRSWYADQVDPPDQQLPGIHGDVSCDVVPEAQLVDLASPSHHGGLGPTSSWASIVLRFRVCPLAETARLGRVVQQVGLDAPPASVLSRAPQRRGHRDHCIPGKEASNDVQVVLQPCIDVALSHALAPLLLRLRLRRLDRGCRRRGGGAAARPLLRGVLRPGGRRLGGGLAEGRGRSLHGAVEAAAALGPRQALVHARAAGRPGGALRRQPAGLLQELGREARRARLQELRRRGRNRARLHLLFQGAAVAHQGVAKGSAQQRVARPQPHTLAARPPRELVVHGELPGRGPLPPQLEGGHKALAQGAVQQRQHSLAHQWVSTDG